MKMFDRNALAAATAIARRVRFALGSCVLGFVCSMHQGATFAAELSDPVDVDRQVDSQTTTDPLVTPDRTAPALIWTDGLRPLWRAALLHDESALRLQAADTIRQAHRYGMPGLVELCAPLRAVLETPGEQPVTRTAAAAALVELDCRDLAPLLSAQAAAGPLQLQLVVEAALARWDYRPARAVWLERLGDTSAHGELRRIAVESLAAVGELRAVEPLSESLLSPLGSRTDRLLAARALADLAPSDVLSWSRRLLAGVSPEPDLDAQLGAELLRQQSSPEAIELLEQYARWPAPAVAAVALRRLLELDPSRVLARAEQTLRDSDANVRQITLEAVAPGGDLRSLRLLTLALEDPVPALRREARRALLRHAADPALRPQVIDQAVQVLATDSWRGLENAIIVLTELQHRGSNDRLLRLIDHERAEVQITAAWAVKHLFEPVDAPRVLQAARRVTAEIDAGGPHSRSQVQVQLFEALGMLKHRPAVELLVKLIPKHSPYWTQSRAAAIWALGFLLDPRRDASIIRALEARLADDSALEPEAWEVKAAAAIALGRIADTASLPVLRQWYESEGPESPVGRSSGWAVMQMTGEPLPDPEPATLRLSDWFIEPLAGP